VYSKKIRHLFSAISFSFFSQILCQALPEYSRKREILLIAIVLQFPLQFYFSDHSLVLKKKKEILFVANLFQLFLKTYLQTLA